MSGSVPPTTSAGPAPSTSSAGQARPSANPEMPASQAMPPPNPPTSPTMKAVVELEEVLARGSSSDVGTGSDRPEDPREASRDKTEEARGARQGRKKVKKSPSRRMQESQVERFSGFKPNAKGKGKAGVAGGKPAHARGASGGAGANRDRSASLRRLKDREEGELLSQEDEAYDPDFVDISSGEEEHSRHNTTPTTPSTLRAASPAPYAALAAYGGYQGDVSALGGSPGEQGQATPSAGQSEGAPSPGPFRRSPSGGNMRRMPDYMRQSHRGPPPGFRGVPEAQIYQEDVRVSGNFTSIPLTPPHHQEGQGRQEALGAGQPAPEEDAVFLNTSGNLTQEQPEPGHSDATLEDCGISPIRGGTPTRDENVPPLPP